MTHTWSKVVSDWKGFQPVAYSFAHKTLKLPLKLYKGSGQSLQEEDSSLGALFQELRDQCIQKIEVQWNGGTVTTDSGSVRFGGLPFNVGVMERFLEWMKDGVNPFELTLYWFADDWNHQEPISAYHFFAVEGNAIASEDISFHDAIDSGFDPSIFDSGGDLEPFWDSERALDGAWTRYWYRRFYEETQTGKLMVLREDNPKLFYYARPTLDLTDKIYRLLWVSLPILCAIAFPSVRILMGAATAALAVDLLFLPWLVRKMRARN